MRLSLFLSALSLISLAAFARDGGQPFEGKWVLDKNSPSFSSAPGHLMEEIKLNGNTLVIQSKYDQPRDGLYPLPWIGIMTEKLDLNSDGSETLNQIGPYRHVSKTTISGNTITTDWTATDEPGNVQGQWIRTISDDGRMMTLQVKGKASDGRSIDSTLQFHRK